jgi:multimeric flavodoxin WrbA
MIGNMKVCLINGSPHQKGCTSTALSLVAESLEKDGVQADIFQLGTSPIAGCRGCGGCHRDVTRDKDHCIAYPDDRVNDFAAIAADYDGYVFGSPVHFAAADGAITSFLSRVFYCVPREVFRLKPGACVVSARRAGTTAAFDQLNKYLTIAEMPVISSCDWNMVHGFTPEDVMQDKEGCRVMRILGHNMAWFLKCKDAGAKAGVPLPASEPPAVTNFIR